MPAKSKAFGKPSPAKSAAPRSHGAKTASSSASPGGDERLEILAALREELARSMADLKLGRHRRPYFISYLLRQHARANLSAKAGAIVEDDNYSVAFPHAEVRVGTYREDNTDPSEGTEDNFDPEGWSYGPLDVSPESVRQMFWLLTDRQYKNAVQEYMEKGGRGANRISSARGVDDFSREEPARHVAPRRDAEFDLDLEHWRGLLREASALFLEHDWIEDSSIALQARHKRQFFANSEGSEHIQEFVNFSLTLSAETTAPRDGMPLEYGEVLNLGRREELPDGEKLAEHVQNIIRELDELRKAPVLPPYNGPALLGPDVTGVIFHEAVGHRLEGERMRLHDEGHTFKGKVGRRIVPAFIELSDDPTLKEFDGESITGAYDFDEQGVPTRPVQLARRGVLKEYLLSRTPVRGFPKSNGHGRSDGRSRAQARMGVFIIKSLKEHPREKLKEILLEECRKQRKSFGLIVEKIDSGLTTTTTHEFQAFAEYPLRVYKVNAKTGQETRVRGVEIVGTPLTAINRIVAMGDDYQLFNGYCGAESGMIPQSEIAPSCVVSEIEVQRSSTENKRPPILPPPSALSRSNGAAPAAPPAAAEKPAAPKPKAPKAKAAPKKPAPPAPPKGPSSKRPRRER